MLRSFHDRHAISDSNSYDILSGPLVVLPRARFILSTPMRLLFELSVGFFQLVWTIEGSFKHGNRKRDVNASVPDPDPDPDRSALNASLLPTTRSYSQPCGCIVPFVIPEKIRRQLRNRV